MARGKAHSDEIRAAVLAALMAGQSVSSVAKEYSLPKSTVSRMRHTIEPELERVGTQKRDRIGELLGEYVETNLITLKAQSEHFRDATWLAKQPASELAVLHGVIADKTIRILEAAEVAADGGASGEEGAP